MSLLVAKVTANQQPSYEYLISSSTYASSFDA